MTLDLAEHYRLVPGVFHATLAIEPERSADSHAGSVSPIVYLVLILLSVIRFHLLVSLTGSGFNLQVAARRGLNLRTLGFLLFDGVLSGILCDRLLCAGRLSCRHNRFRNAVPPVSANRERLLHWFEEHSVDSHKPLDRRDRNQHVDVDRRAGAGVFDLRASR